MHVEHEGLGASWHVGPLDRWRCSLADCNARSGLAELDRNLTAVGKSRNGQSHRRRGCTATFGLTSTSAGLCNYRDGKAKHEWSEE